MPSVIVDTVGVQPISTVHFLITCINQALLLGLRFCLSNLTPQALDIVPGRVKLLLDARWEWIYNGVGGSRLSSTSIGPSGSNVGVSKSKSPTCGQLIQRRRTTSVSSKLWRKLNPYRSVREPLGVKGVRQSVAIINNFSSIDQNQQLLVRFPNLGKDDVIVLGTARLAVTITLGSEDVNRTGSEPRPRHREEVDHQN